MTLRREFVEVPTSFDVTARSLFFRHEPGVGRLLVILPGRNYSCDRPVLHYLRQMALQHGWDVLSAQYSFQVADMEPTEAELGAEVRTAVTQVLVEHLGSLPALLLVGAADPLYGAPAMQAVRQAPNVQWHEFADLDHALEVRGHWLRSAAAAAQVVSACERFLSAEQERKAI